MTIVSPMGQLRPVFADKNGKRLSGGKVFTYEPGTLTPKATYTDALNLIPNTNPINLDDSGEADIYLDGGYRMQVYDRYGALIQDVDNFRTWASGIPAESILYGNQDLEQFNAGIESSLNNRYTKEETYSKSEVDTSLSLKADKSDTYTKAEVDTTFAAYVGGRKAYQTLALAQADQANLPANTAIEVTNDGANNGTYQWDGTTLTRSDYDPLTQSKNFAVSEDSNLRKSIESDIFVFSSNLFDKDAVTPNTSIDTDGTIIEDSSRWLSDYIPCSPSDVFSIPDGSYRIAFFDSGMNFISRTSISGVPPVSIPALSSIAFFRLSAPYPVETIQLNTGSTLLPYEPYAVEVKKELLPNIPPEKIPTVSPEMTDFFDVSKNLFNKDAVLLNTSIDTDGTIVSDTSRWLSDYIPVSPNTDISLPNALFRIASFDENQTFITRGGSPSYESVYRVRTDTHFIRISGAFSLDEMRVNDGTELLPFQAFGEVRVKPEYLPSSDQPEIDGADSYPLGFYENTLDTLIAYSQVKQNLYVGFRVLHEINTDEIIYKDYWRIMDAGFYTLEDGAMTPIGQKAMTLGESEFVIRHNSQKDDATGGGHGDEMMFDVLFLADGLPIDISTAHSLTACRDVEYIIKSNLHETAEDGVVIEGHPIIAEHWKRTKFVDGGYTTYNKVFWKYDGPITHFHLGISCLAKDVATTVMTGTSLTQQDMTGSQTAYFNEVGASEYIGWNNTTGLSVHANSRLIQNSVSDSAATLFIWDRVEDSKYYCRVAPFQSVNGAITETEFTCRFGSK